MCSTGVLQDCSFFLVFNWWQGRQTAWKPVSEVPPSPQGLGMNLQLYICTGSHRPPAAAVYVCACTDVCHPPAFTIFVLVSYEQLKFDVQYVFLYIPPQSEGAEHRFFSLINTFVFFSFFFFCSQIIAFLMPGSGFSQVLVQVWLRLYALI